MDVPSDVEASIMLLLTHLPKGGAGDVYPRVVLKHQLYHVLHSRTNADKGLVRWRRMKRRLKEEGWVETLGGG